MAVFWAFYFYLRDAGMADIGWAVGLILTGFMYFFLGEGYLPRKILMLILITLWAFRLLWYCIKRASILEEHRRYRMMHPGWRGPVDFKVLLMFLLQALLIVILSLPLLLISNNTDPHMHALEWIGLLIWIFAFVGDIIADEQHQRFKMDPENQAKVLQEGIWYYTRHPNFFFRWLIVFSFFVMALPSPWGWISVISPLLMFYLLIKVSGIPWAEEHALRSKGDAYREYQRTTSPFFPWFKRK
jgi:steroid 5-alpha reductase family enzyme